MGDRGRATTAHYIAIAPRASRGSRPKLRVFLNDGDPPMNKLLPLLTAATFGLAAGSALAHGCPGEMKAIDAKLATAPKLSDADLAKVKKLRGDGEAAHKAGNHDASMKSLGEAKKILGI
jgi:hypothetical protein